ncbi:MAG: hypothetical protein P8Y67_11895 [Alphaproteobacteria bacterium]
MTMMKAKWIFPAASFVLAMTVSAPMSYAFGDDYFSRRDTITESAGDAMATNSVTHTIDPWPPHSKNTEIKIDGKRARLGISRYQSNKSASPKGLRGKSASGSGSKTTK